MSGDTICEKISEENITFKHLPSNQSGDTDCFTCTSKKQWKFLYVVPCGDIDILVTAIRLIMQTSGILIDSGNGGRQKIIWLDSIQLNQNKKL